VKVLKSVYLFIISEALGLNVFRVGLMLFVHAEGCYL
jgi:hypothetical protein